MPRYTMFVGALYKNARYILKKKFDIQHVNLTKNETKYNSYLGKYS